jgi:hypothetical protein
MSSGAATIYGTFFVDSILVATSIRRPASIEPVYTYTYTYMCACEYCMHKLITVQTVALKLALIAPYQCQHKVINVNINYAMVRYM